MFHTDVSLDTYDGCPWKALLTQLVMDRAKIRSMCDLNNHRSCPLKCHEHLGKMINQYPRCFKPQVRSAWD